MKKIKHPVAANHKTKIQCGGACLQQGAICDGYIFDTEFKECVFCSVSAIGSKDSPVSMKMYVKEERVEYLFLEMFGGCE